MKKDIGLVALVVGITLASIGMNAKTLIITHAFNRPDFIAVQNKTFKKFISDSYEYVVFNDANNQGMSDQIQRMCDMLNVRCIRIPQEIHDRPYLPRASGEPYHRPNVRHVNAIQYSLDVLGFDYDGIVMIIDSDMFFIRSLNIEEYVGDNHIASAFGGVGPILHMWPALTILNMAQLPDKRTLTFNCGLIKEGSEWFGADTGGASYYYLKAHPELKVKTINQIWGYEINCPDRFAGFTVNVDIPDNEKRIKYALLGFNENEIQFLLKRPHTIQFLLDNHVLHYRAGTNHDKQSMHYENNKTQAINQFLEAILIVN